MNTTWAKPGYMLGPVVIGLQYCPWGHVCSLGPQNRPLRHYIGGASRQYSCIRPGAAGGAPGTRAGPAASNPASRVAPARPTGPADRPLAAGPAAPAYAFGSDRPGGRMGSIYIISSRLSCASCAPIQSPTAAGSALK